MVTLFSLIFTFQLYFSNEENLKYIYLVYKSNPLLKGYTLWPTPWNAGSKTFAELDMAQVPMCANAKV